MKQLNQLHETLKQQLLQEINILRDNLAFEHQIEYAILSGDKHLQENLNAYLTHTHTHLGDTRQKRQELSAKILSLSAHLPLDLPSLMLSLDDDGCESSALFEQLELLESRIDDQKTRNMALAQAVDLDQTIPSKQLGIQPVYSEHKKRPILVAVEYPRKKK